MSYLHLTYHNWKEDLERYRINVLQLSEVEEKAKDPEVLCVTNCSKTKGRELEKAAPKDFYVSPSNIRFYNWCESRELPYGVLSDEYGLHLWNEELPFYDVHPSRLNKKLFRKLGSEIFFKMESISKKEFLYCGNPPVNCRPYFYMMIIAGMKINYTTKLP